MNAPADNERVLLVCSLSREWYGFDLAQTVTVVPVGEITPVPGTADYLVGVQNQEGRLLAVLDMAIFLSLPSTSEHKHVVIVQHQGIELGCLVDSAEDIVPVRDCDLDSAAQNGQRQCVVARVQIEQRLVGLLDVARLIREVTQT
jgi:purine-binding chemotaxis protein CheW